MTVRLIYGPPGAGKSTYAREHAQDGDLVIDLDDIRANVGNEDTARKLRGVMESTARQHEGDVWIVRTLAKADERAEFMARVGVDEAIPLAVDADTAKERVRKVDKQRQGYYNFFADGNWGHRSNYHMMINSSDVAQAAVAEAILAYVRGRA